MARRRMRKSRRPHFFKRNRMRSGGTGSLIGTVLGAAAYGAFREKISNALAPVTSKVPLGNISDEVVLGGLAIVLKRTIGKRMPLINPILQGAIVIESARIGEAMINGQVGIGGGNVSNANLLG